jgi:hypothetical protein
MNILKLTLLSFLQLAHVSAHTLRVASCLLTNGNLRVFLETYHSQSEALGGSATITVANGASVATLPVTGFVVNTALANLPGCAGNAQIDAVTTLTYSSTPIEDWGYWDFPAATLCGGAFSTAVTLVSGNNAVFAEYDPSLFPATLSVSGNSLCVTPGASGDPHFSTWRGENYEYHGKCDLELVSDPTFADGKGLVVNIRTEIVHAWSYIKNAAIRIGDDIIEVEGGADENRYWFNKVYQGELTTIGGFPVKYTKASSKQRLFKVDLGDGEELQIRTYKEFVRVDFKEPKEDLYGNTVGLLADFKSGMKLARDGVNVIEDCNEFGQEWQVLPDGPMLFHEVVGPQSPNQKCILPIEVHAEEKRRRLGEATVTEVEAELACAKVSAKEHDACVFDVLATDDIDMAGAY